MANPNERRWLDLWQRLGVSVDMSAAYRDLTARYAEPQRAYHCLAHVEHCLRELDAAPDPGESRAMIELALWYHDALYDPRAKDNEERSADLVDSVAAAAGIRLEQRVRVRRLIVATRHAAEPSLPDERLVVDVDLAILGQAPGRYDAYAKQVAAEYDWVPAILFRRGRREILKSFLNRPTIYSTAHFLELYEAAARANLARELASL